MRHDLLPRDSHDTFRRLPQIRDDWTASRRGLTAFGWDRILACVGTESIPVSDSKRQGGAPGKSSRAIFAFYRPRPPLGSLTQENGHYLMLLGRTRWIRRERRRSVAAEERPSGTASPCRRITADFLRSRLRRTGLGHPLGRDPLRTSLPASRVNLADSIGHQLAQSNLVGRLRRWLLEQCASNTP